MSSIYYGPRLAVVVTSNRGPTFGSLEKGEHASLRVRNLNEMFNQNIYSFRNFTSVCNKTVSIF